MHTATNRFTEQTKFWERVNIVNLIPWVIVCLYIMFRFELYFEATFYLLCRRKISLCCFQRSCPTAADYAVIFFKTQQTSTDKPSRIVLGIVTWSVCSFASSVGDRQRERGVNTVYNNTIMLWFWLPTVALVDRLLTWLNFPFLCVSVSVSVVFPFFFFLHVRISSSFPPILFFLYIYINNLRSSCDMVMTYEAIAVTEGTCWFTVLNLGKETL